MTDAGQPARPAAAWTIGEAYDPYVGRWSRRVATEFVPWLDVPTAKDWLDVGCGTGALSQTILQFGRPHSIKGIDRSDGFIAFARAHTHDVRAKFEVGDAQELPVETATYDAVVSGLMLNFVPQPDRALAEMARAARPGGVVAAYVWDYAGKMQLLEYFWGAAAALDPGAAHLDEWRRFPLCNPDPLRQLFQGAGLHDVEVRAIEIAMGFRDFDDYWSPFLGGQGPAPSYAMALSPERRAALRERLRATLPFAPDGSIPLAARGWAVRGRR